MDCYAKMRAEESQWNRNRYDPKLTLLEEITEKEAECEGNQQANATENRKKTAKQGGCKRHEADGHGNPEGKQEKENR